MSAPLLVLAWGNPSRGDDALGPLFLERVRALCGCGAGPGGGARVEYLEDFQLQVEHALDLQDRERVLLVDASADGTAPFEATVVTAARDASLTTHAMSPAALLQVYRDLFDRAPPPCTLLAIRGARFGLGAPPSEWALANLAHALAWGQRWLEPAPRAGAGRMPAAPPPGAEARHGAAPRP
jgi:hydrogenase maturation protease